MPPDRKLNSGQMWKAIELYLARAYPGQPPAPVRERLRTLQSTPESDIWNCSALEPNDRQNPTRWSLRLGNRFYPHMKLTIETSPDGQGWLFRADTHDKHCCPAPGSREYDAFRQLMAENQNLAQNIEADWEQAGIPTFKTYLKADLARRLAESPSSG